MRRNWLLAAAGSALLALAACGGDSEETAANDAASEAPAAPGAASGAAANEPEMPAATTAQGFAARAALSDMFEIQSSQLALERTQNPQLRQFAQRMINEHQTMTNQMQAALQQAGVTVMPPAQLDAEKQEAMESLRGAGPADFDTRYLEVQTEAHENALNLFRDYSGNGDNDVIKQLATRGAPMIENHLQTLKALREQAEKAPAGAPASGGAAQPS